MIILNVILIVTSIILVSARCHCCSDQTRRNSIDDHKETNVFKVRRNREQNATIRSYKGYQLWKVKTDTPEKMDFTDSMQEITEITARGRHHSDILISKANLGKIRSKLIKNQINYTILMDDVQESIDSQTPIYADLKLTQKIEGIALDSYHILPDIYSYLEYLEREYSYVKVFSIGYSIEKRPIVVVRVTNGNKNNKAIFIDGGIHGREWISPASLLYLIDHFTKHITHESQELQDIDWYFLPVSNPDGYVFSYTKDRLWRKNRANWGDCYGTDLNRNFGYMWSEGKGNPCDVTFSGSGPFSEPETIAIHNFITAYDKDYWKSHISIHSYGQWILYPFGFAKIVPEDYEELERLGRMVADILSKKYQALYTVGAISDLYLASGVSTDWSRGDIGVKYSYTIELPDTGKFAFLLPANYVIPVAEECLTAIRTIGKKAVQS